MNALSSEEQERRQLADDFLDWRLDRLGLRRSRDRDHDPAPAQPAAQQQRRIYHTVPMPLAEHHWRLV
jgi:hypothetical protein